MAQIASLVIADPPELWAELGFSIDDDACWVSGIEHRLGASGSGIQAWSLTESTQIARFPTVAQVEAFESRPTPEHANAVTALDHVVVRTGDIDATIEAVEACGIDLRRTRRFQGPDGPIVQAFFKMGEVVLELVGPAEVTTDDPPAFFGLAFVVEDLESCGAYLGQRLLPAKDAVQKGRRIATLDKRAGSSVPMAFMSDKPGAV